MADDHANELEQLERRLYRIRDRLVRDMGDMVLIQNRLNEIKKELEREDTPHES